jgi:hypothetical protein
VVNPGTERESEPNERLRADEGARFAERASAVRLISIESIVTELEPPRSATIRMEATLIWESAMDLPVKFPSETEVILCDVARVRGVTPEERARSFRGFLIAGARIRRKSLNPDWAKQYAEEQEIVARANTREFLERHGY